MNTSKEEAIIQNLQPGKAYTFQVVAHGPQGPGIPSKPIVIMTQEEDSIPTGPRNLRAFPVSHNAIQVQWDAPTDDHGTQSLTYNVYYMQVSHGLFMFMGSEKISVIAHPIMYCRKDHQKKVTLQHRAQATSFRICILIRSIVSGLLLMGAEALRTFQLVPTRTFPQTPHRM